MSSILSVVENISVSITNVVGKKIDITKMFLSLSIFESMFVNFLNGKIVIYDTIDLISNFPIIGNELVEIEIDSSQLNTPISMKFRVYKNDSGEVESKNTKRKVIILYICSEEMINNFLKTINRKFSESTGDTIVQWLLDNPLESSKTLNFETTSDTIDLYTNFWKSSKIIDLVCKKSISSEYFDFIFFENLDGFNFKPLSYYLSQESSQELVYENVSQSFIKLNNIKSYKFNSYFDILALSKIGFFGSTFYNTDEVNYSFTKTETTLSDNEDKFYSLGGKSFFNPDIKVNTNMIKYITLDPEITSARNTLLKLLKQYNISLKMNGDFNRKTGNIVNFFFPNIDNENDINGMFDGNFLVTAPPTRRVGELGS